MADWLTRLVFTHRVWVRSRAKNHFLNYFIAKIDEIFPHFYTGSTMANCLANFKKNFTPSLTPFRNFPGSVIGIV